MKRGSSNIWLSNAKAANASINVLGLRSGLPFVFAAVCALVLMVAASASNDYYQCYQAGHCSLPALSNANDCLEGRDYDVTVTNAGSGATVVSIHGGLIEHDTSTISSELARRYGWNRYDFNAHGTSQCLTGTQDTNLEKLHITAAHFDEPRAVALVAAHPKAVAIHGHGRSYQRGSICIGGKDAAARDAFRVYVNNNAAAWSAYQLNAIDTTTANSGDCSATDLRGDDVANIVNRTSSSAGLQLELQSGFRDDLVNTASTFDALRNLIYEAIRQAMLVPTDCLTVDNAGVNWQNLALESNQTSTFTAEMDAMPQGTNIDAGVGLANGAQTDFAGLACIARFNNQGKIDARNGGVYSALSQISYSPTRSYHLRFVVNVSAHTYSIYVTPAGGSEQAVGINYAFRTEQAIVGSLNNWSLFSDSGAMRGCGFAAPCYTATAGGNWLNNSLASQAGAFTAEWDAMPSADNIDAVVGLSNGAQTSFSGFACLVRFNSSGQIDARDGGTYRSASTIPYAHNTSYHFRLSVNVPAHTYSIYVTPAGGTEQLVGLNHAFRTEQSIVGSLNNYGLIVDSTIGSARVCNFTVSGSNTLVQDSFTGSNGLITNEYTHWNSDGILSPDWDLSSGSLFRQSNTAWTGVPDSLAPNKYSSDHTDSDVFRVNTFKTFAGNIKVSLALKINSEIHDSNCDASNTCWHGVHIWLRHLTQYDLYAISLNRADNKVVIKRKVPCGDENNGFYKDLISPVTHAWSVGTWQHYSVTIQTNSNGSVTIKVYDDDSDPNAPFLQATDAGGTNTSWTSGCATPGSYPTSQYPPITAAGSVGVRGDFDNFNFDDFRIASF
jgi:phage replication-related protein YjqB (UPF0714/DUF867 family)